MLRDNPFMAIFISLMILVIVFFVVDGVGSSPYPFYGKIIDKHYQGEINSTGVGMTSNGKMITTSQHQSEQFMLVIENNCGEIITFNCEANFYYQKEIGDSVKCNSYRGLFTNYCWLIEGVK